jgi:phosphoribosylamine--glycine ligase
VDETDYAGILRHAKALGVDLVVVGPEAPLCGGLVDRLKRAGIAAFGPSRDAAQLEGSKEFANQVCVRARILKGPWWPAQNYTDAANIVRRESAPLAIKADGLAAGKGVVIAETMDEALTACYRALVKGVFGNAGKTIVIERKLVGPEFSAMFFCDGRNARALDAARDYKRIGVGNIGENTGGMGAYSPLPDVNDELMVHIQDEMAVPVLREMEAMGMPFHGILYVGGMLTQEGPRVIEFNVRFGDPEVQALLLRLKSDLVDLMEGTLTLGGLSEVVPIEVSTDAAVCFVLASPRYPGKPEIGLKITGDLHPQDPRVHIYHAGTEIDEDGALRTSGGRVMSVAATGKTREAARLTALQAAKQIFFRDAQGVDRKVMREDIAIA